MEIALNRGMSLVNHRFPPGIAGSPPNIESIISSYAASRYSSELSTKYEDASGTIPASIDGLVGYVNDFDAHLGLLTQSATSSKPLLRYTSNLYNLEFDGIDDQLNLAATVLTQASDYTVIIGIQAQNVTGTGVIFSHRGSGTNPIVCRVSLEAGIPRVMWRDDAGVTVTLNAVSTIAWADTTLTITKSGNTRTLRVNGVQVATDTTALGTTTLTQAAVGYDPFEAANYFQGKITNIVIDPNQAIAGTDLTTIETWVTYKNALSIPTANLTVNDIASFDNAGNVIFTVTLSRTVGTNVTVNYATANVTALAGTNYTTTSGTLTFAPGDTSKTVSVPVTASSVGSTALTFSMNLSNVSANASILDAQGICTLSSSVIPMVASYGGVMYDMNPNNTFTDSGKTTNPNVGDPIYVSDDIANSGTTYDLSQSTLSKRPILRQDANGKYYAEFTGANSQSLAASSFVIPKQEITSTVTIDIATPGLIHWAAHGLANDTPVAFTTTGALPTGMTASVAFSAPTLYYVRNATADTFEIASTPGGASIALSGTQSGTQTGWSSQPLTYMIAGFVVTPTTTQTFIDFRAAAATYTDLTNTSSAVRLLQRDSTSKFSAAGPTVANAPFVGAGTVSKGSFVKTAFFKNSGAAPTAGTADSALMTGGTFNTMRVGCGYTSSETAFITGGIYAVAVLPVDLNTLSSSDFQALANYMYSRYQ